MYVKKLLLGVILGSGVSLATTPASAACLQSPVRVRLPAQRLDARLQDISHKTGCPLNVDLSLVGRKRAPAVRGNLTAAQMLNLSLMKSGLVSSWEDNHWVIKPHED